MNLLIFELVQTAIASLRTLLGVQRAITTPGGQVGAIGADVSTNIE